jgi:hypothetical protein
MIKGEFDTVIDACETELIKQKFWPMGMRNTVKRARKEFPRHIDEQGGYVYSVIELDQWFLKWFGNASHS